LAFEQPIKTGLFLIVDGLIMDNHTVEITEFFMKRVWSHGVLGF
jgi:hypothetical protein